MKNKKTIYISLMKKKWDLILEVLILLPVCGSLPIMAAYFGEERRALYLIPSVILLALVVLMILEYALNGLYITSKGRVIFVPDLRVASVKSSELQRISINLTEDETGIYYACVKLVYRDGDSFVKDYRSKIYRSRNYTGRRVGRCCGLTMKEINRIPAKLDGIDFVNLTVIDKKGRITEQYLSKTQ